MDILSQKKELRKEAKSYRKSLSEDDRLDKSNAIISNLKALKEFQKAEVILIYASLPDEVETLSLIRELTKDGKKLVYCPVIQGDEMEFYKILSLDDLKDYKTFLKNRWEVLQDVSYERGGWDKVGSCIWADIRESVENELYSDKRQIVGHTQMQEKPYITTKIACLDVRKCFILNTETNEIMGTDA